MEQETKSLKIRHQLDTIQFTDSANNLAINRSDISKYEAQKLHPLKEKISINNKKIYINDFNYTTEKFHISHDVSGGKKT